MQLLAFGSEETNMQLSLVIPNPGSSYTNLLQDAAYIRPQGDQSCTSKVYWWESWCHACPIAPEIIPLGLSLKKDDDDITQATNDWKGLRIILKLTF